MNCWCVPVKLCSDTGSLSLLEKTNSQYPTVFYHSTPEYLTAWPGYQSSSSSEGRSEGRKGRNLVLPGTQPTSLIPAEQRIPFTSQYGHLDFFPITDNLQYLSFVWHCFTYSFWIKLSVNSTIRFYSVILPLETGINITKNLFILRTQMLPQFYALSSMI